jgi:hypothetical protein
MTRSSSNPVPAPTPAAYCVAEANGQNGLPNKPGHLFFFVAPTHQGGIPPEQESARDKLEHVASVMRIVFPDRSVPFFKEHFETLLLVAQGAFTPQGFHAEALNTLEGLKNEIVQQVGAKIKSSYPKRLGCWAFSSFVVLLGISLIPDWITFRSQNTHRAADVAAAPFRLRR